MRNCSPWNIQYISADDSRIEEHRADSAYSGSPQGVVIAKDVNDIRLVMSESSRTSTPITFAAAQTSMTGASTADEGLIVDTRQISGVVDISNWRGRPTITVKPATLAANVQLAAEDAGYYYPAVPTSKDESMIGGNVSTNASGEDSYKYGSVRKYVRRLKVILINGEEKVFERDPNTQGDPALGRAGYYEGWKNPIDLFVGGEGTLGFISEITLDLLPRKKPVFMMLIPFESNMTALASLVSIAKKAPSFLRAVEFIDRTAFKFMAAAKDFPRVHKNTAAWIYLKIEYSDKPELGKLYKMIVDEFDGAELLDHSITAMTEDEMEAMRLWRHRIPDGIKEIKGKLEERDGAKVGGDWWVPLNHLTDMISFYYDRAAQLDLVHMAYAHLGQGHPHTNILAHDGKAATKARTLQRTCCYKAVRYGGGVRAEHGVGKLYRDLLELQHSTSTIEQFRKWKIGFDPKWLLGRGNILEPI